MADPLSPDDRRRSRRETTGTRRDRDVENRLQVDPALSEGRVRNRSIAVVAIGIAVVLGAVFYALNNISVHDVGTPPPAQTARTQGAPGTSSRPNATPGTTTGTAPAHPTAPRSQATGSEVDRAAQPPGNNGATSKANNETR